MVDVARTRFAELEASPWEAERPTIQSVASQALERLKSYTRDEPIILVFCAFGIGIALGWRWKARKSVSEG